MEHNENTRKKPGGLRYVTRDEPDYPSVLNRYERMPSGLYVKGSFPDPSKKSAAVIGARNCSSYGRSQALHFSEVLAREGVQIISGLAYGVDTCAHQGALKGRGATFAVLGCGADICYPRENYLLYEEILKNGGGILSEYEPGTPPLSWHFPIRNRIISGLADVILVVEARKKSGSLITADYALEQGKSVFAIPGRVGDACSAGCNALIAQGAGIAWEPEAVLEELFGAGGRGQNPENPAGQGRETGKYGFGEDRETENKPAEKQQTEKLQDEEQRKVYACLQSTELSLEEICTACDLEPGKTAAILTILCMEGLAVSRMPGYYCRVEEWE